MTRPSSSPSEPGGLFGPTFATPEITARTDRAAWLTAMLDVESALATVQAKSGMIPESAARDIARCCRIEHFDARSIAERAEQSATPVIPLVRDLTALVDASAKVYVHNGATSQDIVDTAAMLVVRRACETMLSELRAVRTECARLAREHRDTPMVARTLLQHALPTTFGRRCAGWLVAVGEATDALERLHRDRLAVQLGGAAGTLAAHGTEGVRLVGLLAGELGLAEPVLPWHTDRIRIAEIAGALGTVSGALGTIALDVKLQAQTEVAELSERASGGSSALPHKRNPVGPVLVTAATTRVPGLVGTLLSAMPQEHERAAGAWQAEWEPLTELLRLVGGAATHTRRMLSGLDVHPDAMAANMARTQGLIMAESVGGALSTALGRTEAQDLVAELCRRVVERGTTLRAELTADPRVRNVLSEAEIVSATEPERYLGSAGVFVDRALAREAE